MRHSAKLFMKGRYQAVRFPLNLRFDCDEVYIRNDLETGDIIISKKPQSWGDFFKLIDTCNVPEDFMDKRDNECSQDRGLF